MLSLQKAKEEGGGGERGDTNEKKRCYISAYWTNIQVEPTFYKSAPRRVFLQKRLDEAIRKEEKENASNVGFFTIVQHDVGISLKVPTNTLIFGTSGGHHIVPLIYEDRTNYLKGLPKKSFHEKKYLCSFVGTISTHRVRTLMEKKLSNKKGFYFRTKGTWHSKVPQTDLKTFVEVTSNSKFALAPRGFGPTSFRFYEIFLIGSIPIYIWEGHLCLPYLEFLDYSKFCIVIHSKEIDQLPSILSKYNDEKIYQQMLFEYEKIAYLFTMEGTTQYILEKVQEEFH
jgi:hypothetical protein